MAEVAAVQARVLRLNGSPEKIDEGVEAYKSGVVPAIRERDGYSGARLIVDRRTGAAMSISFWRDGETSQASFEAMSSVRAVATSTFGAGTPEAKVYEAVVQHRPRPTEAGNWVRVTTLSGDPTRVDEGIRHFESQVIPEMSKLQGFRAAILLVDRATGEAVSFTVWDSERDLEASSSQAGPVRATASEVMGATDPQVESYEVAFAELPAPVGP
jgi:heme-degrading monooxygenase HmoA